MQIVEQFILGKNPDQSFCEDGILITDNVLQEGDIIESRYAVTRRNRTIYERMREYLYAVTHSDELVTSIAPIGDGLTISIRK